MNLPEHLIRDLPDRIGVEQFARRFEQTNPGPYAKLLRNPALLSDMLTLAAYSPLLATTMIQNPAYATWLERRRSDKGVRGREQLLESLARFSLTNSTLDRQVMFARFRRRELLRIYLADIRRQMTVAEITEELSNLADAILEFALRTARQEMDNRYGAPLENDGRGRETRSRFCIVSLGKLGSRELNYASDIDLLFLYSGEGSTAGHGTRGKVTNREYFVKLAEFVAGLVGKQSGEGATFRVDLRLRPHGRVGPLAMSVADTINYYRNEAAEWERQVLIRSRASAGDAELFTDFQRQTVTSVFSDVRSVDSALRSVRRSKQRIDIEHGSSKGFDAKLGRGGIREIEFIAQALQLAYGGKDGWLRSGHTLISLSRLRDRNLLSDDELSDLYSAYEFLRRLEHILQMENGLQTHLVPQDEARRHLLALRMQCSGIQEFDEALAHHTSNVSSVFQRVFSDEGIDAAPEPAVASAWRLASPRSPGKVKASRSQAGGELLDGLRQISPKFAALIRSREESGPIRVEDSARDYRSELSSTVEPSGNLAVQMAALRIKWQELLIEIAALDAAGLIDMREAKVRQTQLAEASLAVSFALANSEFKKRYKDSHSDLQLGVMGLGKLGGATLDYESDLDLLLVFNNPSSDAIGDLSPIEYYSRAAELFVDVLSGYTRHGNLYRVDLRLRPHGKNGTSVISRSSFLTYVREDAAIWELLAFVKLRAAHGAEFAAQLERETAALVSERGSSIDRKELAAETRRVRLGLEAERGQKRSNIKYGPGGMLDVYFALRYLQLREGIPDDPTNRSSDHMIRRLFDLGILKQNEFDAMTAGYAFLSRLDHSMRLIIGRSSVVPHVGNPTLQTIISRIGFSHPSEFFGQMELHRIAIRDAFDSITK